MQSKYRPIVRPKKALNSARRPRVTPSADARLTAVTARQSAIVGALAALLATAVTIPATLWTSERASETANEQFLRSQRVSVYANIINTDSQLKDAEKRYLSEESEPEGNSSEAEQARAACDKLSTTLTSYTGKVHLLSSEATSTSFEELKAAHQSARASIDYWLIGSPLPMQDTDPSPKDQGQDPPKITDQVDRASSTFLKDSRADLGVS